MCSLFSDAVEFNFGYTKTNKIKVSGNPWHLLSLHVKLYLDITNAPTLVMEIGNIIPQG